MDGCKAVGVDVFDMNVGECVLCFLILVRGNEAGK